MRHRSCVSERMEMAALRPEEDDDVPIERQDRFVKWIPVVVPLAALVLAALVFLIGAAVL
ncbi:MAG: hypothetical protein ACT4P3_17865 [Betaproteobacteria bacterium]